jgi:hypothetical protein
MSAEYVVASILVYVDHVHFVAVARTAPRSSSAASSSSSSSSSISSSSSSRSAAGTAEADQFFLYDNLKNKGKPLLLPVRCKHSDHCHRCCSSISIGDIVDSLHQLNWYHYIEVTCIFFVKRQASSPSSSSSSSSPSPSSSSLSFACVAADQSSDSSFPAEVDISEGAAAAAELLLNAFSAAAPSSSGEWQEVTWRRSKRRKQAATLKAATSNSSTTGNATKRLPTAAATPAATNNRFAALLSLDISTDDSAGESFGATTAGTVPPQSPAAQSALSPNRSSTTALRKNRSLSLSQSLSVV